MSRHHNVALALFRVNVIGQAPARARIEGACGDVPTTYRPRSPLIYPRFSPFIKILRALVKISFGQHPPRLKTIGNRPVRVFELNLSR